ncbi:hypothetical protein I4U23_020997 [Adineta vaga]|nr:hypothetical protein I4U23_020997 [Adineta vaga]
MVDPYDFTGSPTVSKSKQTRSKSRMKVSKKRKSNEKPRRTSIRQANNDAQKRTRSNTRDADHLMNMVEKENHPNNGFTQLVQTKMMDVKKRPGKPIDKKTNVAIEREHSPSILRKRQRTDDNNNTERIPSTTETDHERSNHQLDTNDAHAHVGATTTTTTTTGTCHPRCESKDHQQLTIPANKRRRACLCSKRQLDELEFASDSVPSQIQEFEEKEQEQPPDEPQLQPILTTMNASPPPLLLPSSSLMQPVLFTFPIPSVPSISIIQPEETNEEERQENQLNISSIMAAPLSPAMPLNSTYIAAHRSIPLITPLPPSLLALSTLSMNTTMISSENVPIQSTSSIIQMTNLEPKRSNEQSVVQPSVEVTSNRQDQETSMTPTSIVQTMRCSVSTQTDDDYQPTHHHCNDVSVCPCVQIYTRSEQLFMASMAIFFRNSITITPPDPSSTTITNSTRKNNKRQLRNHQTSSSESTPIIHEIELPIQADTLTVQNNNNQINETYVVNNKIDPVSIIELEPQRSSLIQRDTSTVINETRYENSKKSDGSSIQINIDSRQDVTENKSSPISSDDQKKFQSLVLTMTALKDHQKIEFNRFLERFSVRSSTSIDDTTTHLITDEDENHSLICPLTGKVLQAVTRHLKIVSYRWLTACLTEQRYIDEIPTYEIIGDAIYNEHHGMSRSCLNYSNNYHLLANYAFHLKCHGCQPFLDNRPLIELIHLSGGLILKTLNQHIDNTGRQIIILCSKTYLQNKPALQQACQKFNIFCIEPEWLIASIVKFEIQPYESWLCTLYS